MSVTLACLSIVIVVFIHTGILCVIVGADNSAGINWNWINCKKKWQKYFWTITRNVGVAIMDTCCGYFVGGVVPSLLVSSVLQNTGKAYAEHIPEQQSISLWNLSN